MKKSKPINEEKPVHFTPAQVARRLSVGVAKVTAWITSGQLRAIDVSSEPGPGKRRRFRITEADLAVFEELRATGHLPPAASVIKKSRKPERQSETFV